MPSSKPKRRPPSRPSHTTSSHPLSSASATDEDDDPLPFITTGLAPSTPSPPSSPSTPYHPTPLSSSSSHPPPPPDASADQLNDAMIFSPPSSPSPSPPSPSLYSPSSSCSSLLPRLIPTYAVLPSSPQSPPSAYTPLLSHPATPPTSSTFHRRTRKALSLLSSPLSLLLLSSLSLLLLSSLNGLLWVSISSSYSLSHAFFLDQICGLLFLAFLLPPLLTFRPPTPQPPQPLLPPSLLIIASLDALYGLFITLGSAYTPGSFQLILYQLSLIFSFLFSSLLAPHQVRWRQVIGCGLIFASSLVAIVPSMRDEEAGKGPPMRATSVLVYVVGVFLFSVNCVLKERWLKGSALDVFTFSALDQGVAWLVTFALAPLLFIPHISDDTPSTFLPHLWSGVRCFLVGTSSVPGAVCAGVWLPTLLFSFSNVLMQLLMLVVLRLSSTFLLNLLSTIQLPLSSLLFSFPSLLHSAASPLTPATLIALLGVTAGSLIYGGTPTDHPHESTEEPWDSERLLTQTHTVGVMRGVGPGGDAVLGLASAPGSRRGSEAGEIDALFT